MLNKYYGIVKVLLMSIEGDRRHAELSTTL